MLTYNLDERNEDPLYVYLYKCIKKDIEDGIVHPHDGFLPSGRSPAISGSPFITVESATPSLWRKVTSTPSLAAGISPATSSPNRSPRTLAGIFQTL